MKRNLKIMNFATYCNMLGNLLIFSGSMTLVFACINYTHNFTNILKESRKELVRKYEILTPEEFVEIKIRSTMKAREDLLILLFGVYGKDSFYKFPWYQRPINTEKKWIILKHGLLYYYF
jgi:hypothetical protein